MASPIGQDCMVFAPGVYSYQPLGYAQITLSGGAVDLTNGGTLTVPASARMALISVSSAGVRWRDDGTAPTAAIGMPVASAQEFQYSADLSKIQFIAQSGTPVLDIAFYK